jgi:hypothetical protein
MRGEGVLMAIVQTTGQAPSVGWDNLLAGLVGVVLAFLLTEFRRARERSSERSGIARLLHAEISWNLNVLRNYDPRLLVMPDQAIGRGPYEEPTLIKRQVLPLVRLDAWRESRVRIAALLNRESFSALEAYYRELENLLDVKPVAVYDTAHRDEMRIANKDAKDRIDRLEQLQASVRSTLEVHIEPPWQERWFDL